MLAMAGQHWSAVALSLSAVAGLGGAVPWRPLPRLVAVPGTRASRAAAAALEVTSPCLASDQG